MTERNDDPIAAAARFWPVILLSALIMAGAVAGLAAARPPAWTSTESVLYGSDSSSLLSGAAPSTADVQRTLATQAQIVLSDQVLDSAASGLDVPLRELRKDVQVTDLPDSNVLTISVSAASAREAKRRTELVTNGYIAYSTKVARQSLADQAESLSPSIAQLRRQLARVGDTSGDSSPLTSALSSLVQRQIQLSSAAKAEEGAARVISTAELPETPSSVSTKSAALVGAGIGLVLGFGLALLLGRRRKPTGARRRTYREDGLGTDAPREPGPSATTP
jgi:uncharacterized protein involved in exopolysaccharide biosynthesis